MRMQAAWQLFVERLWPLTETEPAIAPLIFEWSWKWGKTEQGLQVERVPVPLAARRWLARRVRIALRRATPTLCAERRGMRDAPEHCDVLLACHDTHVNSFNISVFLGQAVVREAPSMEVGIVTDGDTGSHVTVPEPLRHFVAWVPFHPETQQRGRAHRLLGRITARFEGVAEVQRWLQGTWKERLREVVRVLEGVDAAARWLKRLECRMVITPIEQWEPASLLVAAASRLGIPSAQILNGMPGRRLWPFLADELWVWGPPSQAAFAGRGALLRRLPIVGPLEVTLWNSVSAKVEPVPCRRAKEAPTLLFLAQWHGSRVIGADGFRTGLEMLRSVLLADTTHWRVVVRPHPSDTQQDRDEMAEMLSPLGQRAAFTEPGSALTADIRRADAVWTVASSAVVVALAQGIPGGLIWTPDMPALYGPPPLASEFVARSPAEFAQRLENPLLPREIERALGRSLHHIQDSDVQAARRVLARIEDCSRSQLLPV